MPAHSTAIAAAKDLAPAIAARADEIEAARRLPADLAHDMAAAGLFRMIVPQVYGGLQTPAAELVEAIETIARADASAGWCMMIAATTALNAAYLPAEEARAIYADPLGITGGVFAPLGKAVLEDGQLTVSGRWAWASGSQNCNWLLGGCVIIENGAMRTLPNGAPDHRMVFVPANDVELIDTWHVAGLKGTGSLDMAIHAVRAPYSRSVSLITDKPHVDGALYAFPAFGLLALGIAAVALGNARGALDALIELAAGKRQQGAKRTLAERGHTQMEVAKAEAELSAARAFLFDEIGAAWRLAQAGGAIPTAQRARLRLAATHAARTGAGVAYTAYDLAGGSAVYLSNAIQRRFRDAHVATQHIMVQSSTYELTGRVLLGLDVDASTL
jgi:alkylation response protein AidB-like acyl-CoA dehydrogenase